MCRKRHVAEEASYLRVYLNTGKNIASAKEMCFTSGYCSVVSNSIHKIRFI